MKIAVVGTGGVARRHLSALTTLPEVVVVGHVSTEAVRAEAQAAAWGGRAFTSLVQLLDAERPDAVWLCVTPDRHGAPEMALIDAGVPFFVEKPLAVDVPTAERVAARLASAAIVTAVGYKFRALDTLPRVHALLAQTPPRLVLGAWHDKMPPPVWWRQVARSGGQIVEQATHLVDLARVLVGGRGEVVSAMGARWPRVDAPDSDVSDVSAALVRFTSAAGQIPAVFTASCLLQGNQSIQLQLVCEGRVLTLSEQALVVETGRERSELVSTTDPFVTENEAFLHAVRDNDPTRVLCSYADALETHRLCCAMRDAQR